MELKAQELTMLEQSLQAVSEQEKHIRKIFEYSAKNDPNSSKLTRSLEKDIQTAFNGDHKYIFELLQNADDAVKNQENVVVRFHYLPASLSGGTSYLIFSHTGEHFLPHDVDKITDYAQQEHQEKIQDINKTGYKGIGFKSVFSIASCVQIISGGYCFRFDQNYEEWKKDSTPGRVFPWPIIPIWSPTIPTEVERYLEPQRVHFILTLRQGISIQNEFDFLKDNPAIILFLRHVKTVELYTYDKKETLSVSNTPEGDQCLLINAAPHSTWVMKNLLIKVPEKTCNYLHTLGHYECPERLKNAKITRLFFAAEIDKHGKISKQINKPIYSYLPTQVNTKLPYLVNGDFLLNADRTQLADNEWNVFLMRAIGYFQLKWLAELTKTPHLRLQILKLISPTHLFFSTKFQTAFSDGFNLGLQKISFVPMYGSEQRLLKVKEVILDDMEFYRHVSVNLDMTVADYRLEELAALRNKAFKIIDFPTTCQLLTQYANQNKTTVFQQTIINYVTTVLIPKLKLLSNDQNNWESKLSNTPFLLTEKQHIECPINIYLRTEELASETPPQELNVNFIHQDLLVNNKEKLLSLGVMEASLIALIRGLIRQLIIDKKIIQNNVIAITQFIFIAFDQGKLRAEDWKIIKTMPVLTQRCNLVFMHQAYLSDIYRPAVCLEALSSEDIFISSGYIRPQQTHNKMQVELWKDFFSKAGAQSEVRFYLRQEYPIGQAKKDKGMNMQYYLGKLNGMEMTAKKIQDAHVLENFLDCNIFHCMNTPAFAKMFWIKLIGEWPLIIKQQTSRYRMGNGQRKEITLSYLLYFVQNVPCVPTTSPSLPLNTTKNLLTPRLRQFNTYLNVASLDIDLADDQAEFLGFKTVLTCGDCLAVLTGLNHDNKTDVELYAQIFKNLLQLKLTETERQNLKSWQGQLPAQNGHLQAVTHLRCFALKDKSPPVNSAHWLREFPGITRDETIAVSQILDIKVIDASQLVFVTAPPIPELQQDSGVKQHLQQRLFAIACIESYKTGISQQENLNTLWEKLEIITFWPV